MGERPRADPHLDIVKLHEYMPFTIFPLDLNVFVLPIIFVFSFYFVYSTENWAPPTFEKVTTARLPLINCHSGFHNIVLAS